MSNVNFNEKLYDGYDEGESVKDIKGITDKVTDYTFTDISFPCVIFKSGLRLEKHKVKVISNMVKSTTGSLGKDITLYFSKGDKQLYKMGMLSGIQISSLIEIVGLDNLDAFYDENTRLAGSLIYTLCTI